MSDQKIKGMGNLSRTAGETKKKLELSFMPQREETPINQKPEINKSVNTEIPIYGKGAEKPVSINTEIHTASSTALPVGMSVAASNLGNRHKKIVPRVIGVVKAKATFCLDSVAVEQLNQIYIKRLTAHQKSDRSSLICEAISLLFEKENIL